jgi:hypothetical protein
VVAAHAVDLAVEAVVALTVVAAEAASMVEAVVVAPMAVAAVATAVADTGNSRLTADDCSSADS